jgi:hypothetical protein
MRSRRFRLALLAATSLAASLVASAPVQAGPLVTTATSCDDQVFEQPFLSWGDPMNYVLAPAGTLDDGTAAWSAGGSAAVVAGNEPFYVHAPGEDESLALPDGSSATTGEMCVGLDHPTLRFFARNTGSRLGSLRVEVLFRDAAGDRRNLTIGSVSAGSGWQPTAPFPIVANLLPLLPGQMTPVAFRFTPQGGTWTIDDVYVDPRRSN